MMITSLFFATFLFAAEAPDFSLVWKTASPKQHLLSGLPPKGNHFNIEAPVKIELLDEKGLSHERIIKPKTLKPLRIDIPFTAMPAQITSVRVTAFLCDDKLTYCEKHVVTIDAPNSMSRQGSTAPITPEAKTQESPPSLRAKIAVALANSKSESRILMIDFFGIWCPPCNLLEERVFKTKEFQSATNSLIMLKVDADSPDSFELKSKYKIGGYPTLLFLNSDGTEISRIVGYRPLIEILKEVARVKNKAPDPINVHLARREYKEALLLLDKSGETTSVRYFSAKIGANPDNIQVLEDALKTISNDPSRLEWLSELAERKNDRELRVQFIREATGLLKTPISLSGHDLTSSDVLAQIAGQYEKLGISEKSQEFWKKAADDLSAQLRKLPAGARRTNRGINIDLAHCRWKSGDFAGARKIYSEMISQFPHEFTFYFNHARLALDSGFYDEALENARSAQQYSYGDNRLRTSHLLARVLIAKNKQPEAKSIVETALETSPVSKDLDVRTHRYRKALEELQKETR